MLRRLGNGIEIRRYEKQARVQTPFGEVYNKDSYDYATNLLLSVCLHSPLPSSASPSKHKARLHASRAPFRRPAACMCARVRACVLVRRS